MEAGEVGDHRLVVEQRLQPALGDLWLVRRVLRGPARVLEHVAEDGVGDAGPVVTHPDVGPHHLTGQHLKFSLLRDLNSPCSCPQSPEFS